MAHPTTLSKLTRRFGTEIVEDLNRALLERAVEGRLIRGRRLRVDTTCIEADVRYPTDSGLCAHGGCRCLPRGAEPRFMELRPDVDLSSRGYLAPGVGVTRPTMVSLSMPLASQAVPMPSASPTAGFHDSTTRSWPAASTTRTR